MGGYAKPSRGNIKYSGPTNPPKLQLPYVSSKELNAMEMASSREQRRLEEARALEQERANRAKLERLTEAERIGNAAANQRYHDEKAAQARLQRQAPPARLHAFTSTQSKPKESSFFGKVKSFFSSGPTPPKRQPVIQTSYPVRSTGYVPAVPAPPAATFQPQARYTQSRQDPAPPAATFQPSSRYPGRQEPTPANRHKELPPRPPYSTMPPVQAVPRREREVVAPTGRLAPGRAASIVYPSFSERVSQSSRITRFPSHSVRDTTPPVPSNRHKELPPRPTARDEVTDWLDDYPMPPREGMCKNCGDTIVSAVVTFSPYCDRCRGREQSRNGANTTYHSSSSRQSQAREQSRNGENTTYHSSSSRRVPSKKKNDLAAIGRASHTAGRPGHSLRPGTAPERTANARPAPLRIDTSVGTTRGDAPQQQWGRFVPPPPPVPNDSPDSPSSIYSRTTNGHLIPENRNRRR